MEYSANILAVTLPRLMGNLLKYINEDDELNMKVMKEYIELFFSLNISQN